jgi:hypothetical protein
MSKKKSPIRVKTDTNAAPTPQALADLVELASRVAAHVQIKNVLLVGSKLERAPDSAGRDEVLADMDVRNVDYTFDREKGRLFVVPTFSLDAKRDRSQTGSSVFSIEATFALDYSLESIADLQEGHFRAFALTNGVFNAWPYWREYVQSCASRMGLPNVVIPVFRVA